MTTELEDRLREGLREWADRIQPSPGDPHEAMTRAGTGTAAVTRRSVALYWAAAAVLVVLLGAVTVTRSPAPAGPGTAEGTTGDSAPLSLAEPTIVLRPADTRWQVSSVGRYLAESGTVSHFSLSFHHPDGRLLMLELSPPDPLPSGTTMRYDRRLTVRGEPAVAIDRARHHQLRWEEAGLVWTAQGSSLWNLFPDGTVPPGLGFDLDELRSVVEDLAVVDRDTWLASLPNLAVTALGQRGVSVTWEHERGVTVWPPGPVEGPGTLVVPPR